jgi:hypothetical protein
MSHTDQIIAYFLNLFKLQCGDPDITENACQFQPVPSDSAGEPVYNLRVKCGTNWKSRRMSIRQLGEQVESKSICYKVIYDDQLVVKIPAKQIDNFKKYLEYINIERHISLRLAPDIKCVSPSLSAILNKVPGLINGSKLNDKEIEEKYVNLLTNNPRLQSHIKIGDNFVFFMNLSKNSFFNQVIEQMHEEKARVQKEIIKNTWLFDSLEAFEALYGDDRHDVFFSINGVYKDFEAKIDKLFSKFNIGHTLPDFKKKEWFLSILAKKLPDIDEKSFPDNFSTIAQKVFENITETNQNKIHQYQKTVRTFVRKKIFDNNRNAIEGLIINILNLMYHLKNQSVSVRDLKPDNIYLSAKNEGAHYQFWDHESYSLGLIDLETAIDFNPSTPETINQPLLAGTPSYMTPTHIFKNNVLKDVFGPDIHRLMYLQDWYAALSMIFNVATGKMLFVKTAKLIPQIMKMKKKAIIFRKPLQKVFKRVSGGYWAMAEHEFYTKLTAVKERFSSLHLSIPKPISRMLQNELIYEKAAILKTIQTVVNSNILLSERGEELTSMSLFELTQYRALWETELSVSGMDKEEKEHLDSALKILETLKLHLENHGRISPMLVQPITCYDLADYLFNRVMLAMYRHTWLKKMPADAQDLKR